MQTKPIAIADALNYWHISLSITLELQKGTVRANMKGSLNFKVYSNIHVHKSKPILVCKN